MKNASKPGGKGKVSARLIGFTIMEIMVVTAVIALLAALLLPSLARARAKGKEAVCINNLKQLGLAMQMYALDWNDYLPCPVDNFGDTYVWFYAINPYLAKTNVGYQAGPEERLGAIKQDPIWDDFPTLARTNWRTIKMNRKLIGRSSNTGGINATWTNVIPKYRRLTDIKAQTTTPMLFDGRCEETTSVPDKARFSGWEVYVGLRHSGGAHICFVDGHVEYWRKGTPNSGGGWSTGTTGLDWWVE